MVKFDKLDADFKMKNIWLTGDTHFNHANIVRGTSKWDLTKVRGNHTSVREFDTLHEHDQHLINNINKFVKRDDLLIHVGDWSFGGEEVIEEVRDALNVQSIFLCCGNHDNFIRKDDVKYVNLFEHINDILYLCVEGYEFMACHYPMVSWHRQGKGVPMFFGHTHSNYEGRGRSIDVGVDSAYKLLNSYRPFNLLELKKIMDRSPITTVDHH